MKAGRWWMRVPELARRLLIAGLGLLALGALLGLLFGPPLFAVAPVLWLVIGLSTWSHYRSASKIEDWERRNREAETLRALQREALESKEFAREVSELEGKDRRG
ncbi:MAG: hypothetical protein JO240_01420 [Solirubrobacterales bacterium]|nr:hypothetical protein [Solirubrobacterales bacterium]